MSDKIKFGQEVTEIDNNDGTTEVITEGYFDGLASIKVQRREDSKTSHQTLAADVIKCLETLKTGTPDLNIYITKDRYGFPNIIQKTWTIEKKKIK